MNEKRFEDDKPVVKTDLKKYDKKYVVEDNVLWEVWGDKTSKAVVIFDIENICDLLNSQHNFSNVISNENYRLRMENEQLKDLAEYRANVNNMLITEFRNQIGQATGQSKVALMKLTEKQFVLEYPTKEFLELKEEIKIKDNILETVGKDNEQLRNDLDDSYDANGVLEAEILKLRQENRELNKKLDSIPPKVKDFLQLFLAFF